jgi:hypothetical protein
VLPPGFSCGRAAAIAFSRRNVWLWSGAVFLLVLGARLWLIRDDGSSLPSSDHWVGEAASLYIPFADRCLTWRGMFAFHNEHRIFLTRVLNICLLLLNNQWDATLQTVVNSTLDAAVALLTLLAVWRAIGGELWYVALLVAVAFALPFSWVNTIGGFQSQFYFLALFSILAVWLMVTSELRRAAGCSDGVQLAHSLHGGERRPGGPGDHDRPGR